MNRSQQDAATSTRGTEKPRSARQPVGLYDVVTWLPRTVTRLLLPRLVDRYVLGELLSPLLFGWTMFIILFVFTMNLFKLAQFLSRGADPNTVAELLYLRVILSSVYCLPMAVLLSGLQAFGRLSGESELIATQAGGISNFRPLAIAFWMGLILSFVGLAINEYVIPPAGQRLHYLEDRLKAQLQDRLSADLAETKAFVIQDMEGKILRRLVVAKRFTPEEGNRPATLRDVTYIEYDDAGDWTTIVQSERAEWLGKQRWRFFNADTQFRFEKIEGKRMRWQGDDIDLVLKKSPEEAKKDQKDADEMSYRELKSYIDRLRNDRVRGRIIRELEVGLERKLAIPFASVIFALIGAPLGIRRQRSPAAIGVGLSLIVIILYYIGMSFLGVLGENGRLSPTVAAWGCNIVSLVAGAILTWRATR